MPSSTFSSNSRIPDLSYVKEWIFVLLAFLIVLGVSELFVRSSGNRPSISDDKYLWAFHRADINRSDSSKMLVIMGASRAQLGIMPGVLEEALPGIQVKQLANAGGTSQALVLDLCNDQNFKGTFLWSATEPTLMPSNLESALDRRYHHYFRNEYHRPESFDEKLDAWISLNLQSRFASLSADLGIKGLLRTLTRGQPHYVNMTYDRFRHGRYIEVMTPEQIADMEQRVLQRRIDADEESRVSLPEFEATMLELQSAYSKLKSRGGRLLLLRMPTNEAIWALDESAAPRSLYWDRITELTGIPTIHARDYPQLCSFKLPDGSHLDASDAPEFTRRLAEILKEQIPESF